MEEGSARVSWYESQLLIGLNNCFHQLVCTGVDSGRFGVVLVEKAVHIMLITCCVLVNV